VKIYLRHSYLKDLQILGALPQLMLLQLIDNAYTGEKLTFRTGAFPSLRKLVSQGYYLTEMRFEEDASPHMESIHIDQSQLKSGIIGIKHLPSLKEITLCYYCKVAGLNMLQAEVNQHPNKPVLRLLRDQSHHDLGDVIRSGVEVEATEPQPDDAEESSQVITTADNRSVLLLLAHHKLSIFERSLLSACMFYAYSSSLFLRCFQRNPNRSQLMLPASARCPVP